MIIQRARGAAKNKRMEQRGHGMKGQERERVSEVFDLNLKFKLI